MTDIELPGTRQRDLQYPSDEDLIQMAAEGRREGIEELVRRYQRPIYRFLTRFLDSSEDVEQTTLNVFVRAWEYAPRFQFRAKVSTWLYRIAINLARDLHQRRKSRPQQEALPEEHRLSSALIGNIEEEAMRRMEQAEQYQQLQKAMACLNETDRLLLILYYFEDCSYEDMEAISGLSYKVLKTRLSRARQRLRGFLEP